MMTSAAVAFFAKKGLAAQTREFAKSIGVSHALIFKYFESKDNLLECVFREVFVDHWSPSWIEDLSDRSIPLRDRLISFYTQYLGIANDYNWIRIVFQASLADEDLTRRYINEYLAQALRTMAREIRVHNVCKDQSEPSEAEMEKVWVAHAAIVYFAIRKHIHETAVMADTDRFVRCVIDTILPGLVADSRDA